MDRFIKAKLILLILLFVISYNQNTYGANDPKWPVSIIPDSLTTDAEVVIRQKKVTYKVKAINRAVHTVSSVFTIMEEDTGEDHLFVYYDVYTKVKKASAVVYDSEGNQIKRFKKKDFIDRSFYDVTTVRDDRYLYLDVTSAQYPITVAFEYSREIKGIMRYPNIDIQEYGEAVQQMTYTYELPEGLNISYESINTDAECVKRTIKSGHSYSWEFTNLKPVSSESYTPASGFTLPFIAIIPSRFKVEKYEGSMEDWEHFGKFVYELNKETTVINSEMKALVSKLTKDCLTTKEKIDRIYAYLKENMRYVSVQLGIGGWQSFDVDYVQENKFGDCKALTNYMMVMLEEAGIDAHWALIRSGDKRRAYVPEDFVYPYFNHAILRVPEEDMWLECTSKSYPTGYIGSGNEDRKALIITKEGGYLENTPIFDEHINKKEINGKITLHTSGSAEVEVAEKLSGKYHERIRYYKDNLNGEDKKKYYNNRASLVPSTLHKLEFSYDEVAPEAQIHSEYDVFTIGAKTGERFFIPVNPLNPIKYVPKRQKDRKRPIELNFSGEENVHITYQIPEGFRVEAVPDSVLISSPFGDYEARTSVEKDQITFSRRFLHKKGLYEASEYKAFRKFKKNVAKHEKARIVLIEAKT